MTHKHLAWAIRRRSVNTLDGDRSWLECTETGPLLFKTRRAAANDIERRHGYLRNRADLRAEPHGWRMPRPVRVRIMVEVVRNV
jgi:uncharacterized C2H2 Zn-finger protein